MSDKANKNQSSSEHNTGKDRIAKVMARAGVCSRRDAEKMIAQGRVQLNGQVLDTPAVKVDQGDEIKVDGKTIKSTEQTRLFLYNKPVGVLTTSRDDRGRPTVFDDLPDGLPRLLSVGRLDLNTEGLLLLTNDGALSRYLELPATGLKRTYRVRVYGEINEQALDDLANGITYEGVHYGAIDAYLEKRTGRNGWVVMTLTEGKNREIRNVMRALGLQVNRLVRLSYGAFSLDDLDKSEVLEVPPSQIRKLIPGFYKS